MLERLDRTLTQIDVTWNPICDQYCSESSSESEESSHAEQKVLKMIKKKKREVKAQRKA